MKPTAAQLALIHTGESAAASGLLTVFAGAYQYWTIHHFDFPGLLSFLLIAFLGCMVMVYKTMQADPAFSQAEKDTLEEAKALGMKAIGHIEDMWPVLRGLQAAQKAATPSSVPQPTQPQVTPVVSSSGVPSVPQVPFPAMIAGTQIPPAALNIPWNIPLPPRSWTDTALTQAITPQPPRG